MDAQNPRTLVAGTWQVEMHTYGEFSGGPGSGVWISHDGGTKWEHIGATDFRAPRWARSMWP
jgi:hypothetical protein